ncbi:MAG TPA: NAD(P)-binding domain-containing protein [Acidimicrobiia bacterium]|nr:NAD(P)-binding domain-containing protein [Acidimicrobiia bacterium]
MAADRINVDVVVVGGGQGGLGVAYHLAQSDIDFVVLERGRLGETWLSQRWDSFALNTPNWMNGLPGAAYEGPDPHGFMSHSELADSFEAYAKRFDLPVRTGVTVTGVGPSDGEGRYLVVGETTDGEEVRYETDSVVVASGILQSPRIPPVSSKIPEHVVQLHTESYKSPDALPDGAVLVVGGGQSGAQIVEDLRHAGRTVYFSISRAPRLPRRYRGRDFMDWFLEMGLWDVETDAVEDPAVLRTANPLVSGVGPLGHTVSYQQLARDGVRLMGRLEDVIGNEVVTDDSVVEYIRNADSSSQELRDKIDIFIEERGLTTPEPEPDPADMSLGEGEHVDYLRKLDLEAAEVSVIVWCTGFTADFSWIDLPVTEANGKPAHHNGEASVPGIYFIGFPWLSKRKSGVVLGIDEDARHISKLIRQDRDAT